MAERAEIVERAEISERANIAERLPMLKDFRCPRPKRPQLLRRKNIYGDEK
ncbi:hypothetical protein GPL15_01575 [Clostridium sp. MCC353]|uniref:hypothetical protein n=1 Tax=Clostridium sp. MCC353 TaxID=2592646 RepID=UPI001C0127FD|nr:hypothetical protein [Clostridium sp. MCC353]MBT9775196.1 hypothetical protein [Clostridium sp. MCC353]